MYVFNCHEMLKHVVKQNTRKDAKARMDSASHKPAKKPNSSNKHFTTPLLKKHLTFRHKNSPTRTFSNFSPSFPLLIDIPLKITIHSLKPLNVPSRSQNLPRLEAYSSISTIFNSPSLWSYRYCYGLRLDSNTSFVLCRLLLDPGAAFFVFSISPFHLINRLFGWRVRLAQTPSLWRRKSPRFSGCSKQVV